MAVCPKCGKVIDHLRQYESGEQYSIVKKVEAEIYVEEVEFQPQEKIEYECPECLEVIFTDEEDVKDFLLKSDELQELVIKKINKIKENA